MDPSDGQDPTTLDNSTHETVPVPSPATLPLFATGLGFMALLAWRRRQSIDVGGQ
jgi:hypothetical protein